MSLLGLKTSAGPFSFWRLQERICFLYLVHLLEATHNPWIVTSSFIFQVHHSNLWSPHYISFSDFILLLPLSQALVITSSSLG